ncbi:hypothetical protein RJT34_26372 [Clitoria ternatea]|uniref:Uncharacterized protein n=1 Tax=Clitoria ternatea TaxID=43366 RepID=A0AAN9I935_CLITE
MLSRVESSDQSYTNTHFPFLYSLIPISLFSLSFSFSSFQLFSLFFSAVFVSLFFFNFPFSKSMIASRRRILSHPSIPDLR